MPDGVDHRIVCKVAQLRVRCRTVPDSRITSRLPNPGMEDHIRSAVDIRTRCKNNVGLFQAVQHPGQQLAPRPCSIPKPGRCMASRPPCARTLCCMVGSRPSCRRFWRIASACRVGRCDSDPGRIDGSAERVDGTLHIARAAAAAERAADVGQPNLTQERRDSGLVVPA